MKTTTADGKSFTLTAETVEDYALIDALDLNGMHLRCTSVRGPSRATTGSARGMATLEIDPYSPYSIRAEAGRQALRSLGNLISLGDVVLQQKAMLKEMRSAYSAPVVNVESTVMQGGAA